MLTIFDPSQLTFDIANSQQSSHVLAADCIVSSGIAARIYFDLFWECSNISLVYSLPNQLQEPPNLPACRSNFW